MLRQSCLVGGRWLVICYLNLKPYFVSKLSCTHSAYFVWFTLSFRRMLSNAWNTRWACITVNLNTQSLSSSSGIQINILNHKTKMLRWFFLVLFLEFHSVRIGIRDAATAKIWMCAKCGMLVAVATSFIVNRMVQNIQFPTYCLFSSAFFSSLSNLYITDRITHISHHPSHYYRIRNRYWTIEYKNMRTQKHRRWCNSCQLKNEQQTSLSTKHSTSTSMFCHARMNKNNK